MSTLERAAKAIRAIALLVIVAAPACASEPFSDHCPPAICEAPRPAEASSRPFYDCELDLGAPTPEAKEVSLVDVLDAPDRYMGERVRFRSMLSMRFEQTYLFVPDPKVLQIAGFSFAPNLHGPHTAPFDGSCPLFSVVVEGRVGPSKMRGAKIALLDINYLTTSSHPAFATLDAGAHDSRSDGGNP